MVHLQLERLRRMLDISETERRNAEAKLADAEAKLEESKFAIASLRTSKAALQNTLNQSIQETDYIASRQGLHSKRRSRYSDKEVGRYWKQTKNW